MTTSVLSLTIHGSFAGTRQDMGDAFAFATEGRVKADIELQPGETSFKQRSVFAGWKEFSRS